MTRIIIKNGQRRAMTPEEEAEYDALNAQAIAERKAEQAAREAAEAEAQAAAEAAALAAAWGNARDTVNINRDLAIAAGPGPLDLNNDGSLIVAPDTRSDTDLRNIDALYSRAIRLEQQGISAPVMPFRDGTDTVFNLTPSEMMAMAEYVMVFVEDKYAWSWQVKDQISALEAVEDHDGLAALDLNYDPNWSV